MTEPYAYFKLVAACETLISSQFDLLHRLKLAWPHLAVLEAADFPTATLGDEFESIRHACFGAGNSFDTMDGAAQEDVAKRLFQVFCELSKHSHLKGCGV